MAKRKPIVLDDGANLQQLQGSDEADIPLDRRFCTLQRQFRLLLVFLAEQGIELPPELVKELEIAQWT